MQTHTLSQNMIRSIRHPGQGPTQPTQPTQTSDLSLWAWPLLYWTTRCYKSSFDIAPPGCVLGVLRHVLNHMTKACDQSATLEQATSPISVG